MALLINTHRLPEPAVVIAIEPQGRIDSDAAARLLRNRFDMVLAATRPAHIVVDLSAVPSISEHGLDALRCGREQAQANNTSVEMVDPVPDVQRQLRGHGLANEPDRSVSR